MSKNKNKKKEKRKISPWLYVIFFTLPILLTVLLAPKIDNDAWYLLSEGRYIFQNGIYHIDPLSMHEGLEVVVQNWLSAAIMWGTYSLFGTFGLYTLMIICNIAICILLNKICNLLSDNNKILSLLITFICDITLCSYYVVTRPQVFSFIILLGVIYVLELYIKTDNKKYLYWLPVFSLIEINMHASLWWMIFLFALPYVIDSFKLPIINTEGYKTKPLLIALGISLIVGLINPYTYKAILFIFTSYGDKFMHVYINELLPFSFDKGLCKHMFIVMLAIGIIYALFREGKTKIRYICLFCGTLLLGFMSIKGFSHFTLVAFFPLAYFFKDMFPRNFEDMTESFKKIFDISIMVCGILILGFGSFLYINNYSKAVLSSPTTEALENLKKNFDPKTAKVYSSFNDGGCVEFYGFKPYIDPRAELYLKANNHKEDIFEENYKLQHGNIPVKDFLEKYNFTHLLVKNSDILYNNITDEKYLIIYDNTENGYRLYVNSDILTESQKESIQKQYNTVLEAAKEKASEN